MITLAILVILIALVGHSWYTRDKRKYKGYPLGPPRLPLLGSLPFIPTATLPALAFEKLTKIYGDIVHIKIGLVDAIVVNSFENVKDILNDDRASDKKQDVVGSLKERNLYGNLGIILCNGEPWKALRPFTIRTLRDYGLGKAAVMDVVINEELGKFLKQIHSQIEVNPEGGIQGQKMFTQTITHIMWRLVTGIGYELGDPKTQSLVNISEVWFKETNIVMDITIAYPFVWDMFPNWSGKNVIAKCIGELHEFLREGIRERRECGMYKTDPQNYIDVFLAKIDETKDDPNSHFTDDQLLLCLLDLFQAGGDTSSQLLSFSMLYMLLNPNIQEKVYKEIESVVGKNEMITGDMRSRLPYTHATILESLRFSTIVPFTAPREAREDFNFKGYSIKKGALVLVNLQSAHFTQSHWGDPYNFRPERFITKEGVVDAKLANDIKAFGDGKRICLGKTLAESTIFIFFASIIRSFKLCPVPGHPEPTVDPEPGATYHPQPYQIKFAPRN